MKIESIVCNEREIVEFYANIFSIELKNEFAIDKNTIRLLLKNGMIIVLNVKKVA